MLLRYVSDFLPCENSENIKVYKDKDVWWFECDKINLRTVVNIDDLKKSRRGRDLLKGYSDEKIQSIILARAIRDYCYEVCPYKIKYALTDPKHTKAHQLAVCLVCLFDFSIAEDVLRFRSKGNDTVRRLLANIYKGYAKVKDEYVKIVKEIVERVDEQGRASTYEWFKTKKIMIWKKYFASEKEKLNIKLVEVKYEKTSLREIREKLAERLREKSESDMKYTTVIEETFLNTDKGLYIFHEKRNRYVELKYLIVPVNDKFKSMLIEALENKKNKDNKIKIKVTLEIL